MLIVFLSILLFYPMVWVKLRHRDQSFTDKNLHLFLIYCLLVLMTSGVISVTSHFTIHSFTGIIDYVKSLEDSSWRNIFLFPHVAAALCSTFLGPLLFFKQYRDKYPHHHRLAGKFYVFGTLLSAVIVLPLTLTNAGGIPARIGFTTMATLWFTFTFFAYKYVRRKNFVQHRRWMIRSYAMTFAFVHVNFTYPNLNIYELFGLGAQGVKIMQSVVSWSFNLFVAELYIAATKHTGRLVTQKQWLNNLFNKNRFNAKAHLQAIRQPT